MMSLVRRCAAAVVGAVIAGAMTMLPLLAFSNRAQSEPNRFDTFKIEDCYDMAVIMSAAYNAHKVGLPLAKLEELITDEPLGEGESAADRQLLLETVRTVYNEYPGTTSGEAILKECEAHAQIPAPKNPREI